MEVMSYLSDCIRTVVKAPKGKSIAVCDLSSIESRVLGWHSQCTRLNNIYEKKLDGYKDYGSEFYGVPYDQVTKEQRSYVKPPSLGCGYGLGGPGLVEYAAGMGVVMPEDDAKRAVKVFRDIYPEVPNFWYWLLEKSIKCIKDGTEARGYGVRVYRDEHFMFIELPSGEKLCYYHPLVEMIKPPWKGNPPPRETMTYMGRHKKKRLWVRNTTHGGMLVENICQSLARDILMYHMRILDRDIRFEIVGHVHDEIICLVDYGFREEAVREMERMMSITPPWCPGMLLGAAGFYTDVYTKH